MGWLLLVTLLPLLVNLWGQQPFELPKSALVRTIVWLLAGGTLATHLLARPTTATQPRPSPLRAPLILLALVITVTTITATDWRTSLWGSYARNQGATTLLTYLLLCGLAAAYFRPIPRARRLIQAMLVSSIPLIIISLLQSAGWQLLPFISDARAAGYATLGRANFVGAYLAMLAPLTLAFFVRTPSSRATPRLAWLLLFVAQLATIALSQARSAWLGVAVALGLFVLLWWGNTWTRPLRTIAWSILTLLALAGPGIVLWQGPARLDSIAARWHIWQGVWHLIVERPLLGYGPDALATLFWRVYPPQLVYLHGRDIIVDRSHNLILDWLVSAGVPGLLAYGWVLATFIAIMARALRRPQSHTRRALLIGVLAAVTGNTVNNLTSFDVTVTAMTTWLLIGLGVALAIPTPPIQPAPPHRVPYPRAVQLASLALLVLGISFAVWQINVRPLRADIAAYTTQRALQTQDWARAQIATDQAIAHWPQEAAHYIRRGQTHWQIAQHSPQPRTHLARAEQDLRQATHLRPRDPVVWHQLAEFYRASSRTFGLDTHDLAAAAYTQAIALAPTHATLYVGAGRAALEVGDTPRAATHLRQAVALDASHGEAYLLLTTAEAQLGRWPVALADAREAVRLLPASPQAHTALAHCYWQLGQRQAALAAITQALRLAPHDADATALYSTMLAATPP